MRPLEFNMTMGRTQDVTPIKRAEEMHPVNEQQQIAQNNERTTDLRREQVYQKKDEDLDSQYDASKGNGNGGYQGNDRRKQKKHDEEDGKVVVKSRATFDVKI